MPDDSPEHPPRNDHATDPTGNDQPPFPTGLGRRLLIALLVDLLVLALLLIPFQFTAQRGPFLGLPHTTIPQLLIAILLFIPVGLFEMRVVILILPHRNLATLLVLVDAILLALIAETTQLWMPDDALLSAIVQAGANPSPALQDWIPTRQSSLIDPIAAAAGALIGALLMRTPRKP